MKALGITFTLIVFSANLAAQNFRAKIVDSETKLPVPIVSIQYGETGVISDSVGFFMIEELDFPVIISLSHIGYHPREVIIQSQMQSGMTIEIIPKTVAIQEVQILGERVKRFFEKKYFWVTDYLLLEQNILLIGYEKSQMSKGIIAMTNYRGDTLSSNYIEKPKRLFRDVFGQIFLFANDSAYQVFFDGDKFNLLFPQLAGNFPESVLDIQFMLDDDNCLIRKPYVNGQVHRYRRYNLYTKEVQDIAHIYDRSKHNSLPRATNHQPMFGGWGRAAFERSVYYNRMQYKPVMSFSYPYYEGLIIFDLSNKESLIYDKDQKLIKTVKNTFPEHAQYDKNLIRDPIANKFYWVHYRGHNVTLQEVDIDKGIITRSIKIPPYPFIENIQIHDGEVWFLYQPRLGETVKSLFRLR